MFHTGAILLYSVEKHCYERYIFEDMLPSFRDFCTKWCWCCFHISSLYQPGYILKNPEVELTLTDTMFMASLNENYYCVNKQSTQLSMYHLMQHVLSVKKVISSLQCLLENIETYIIAVSVVLRSQFTVHVCMFYPFLALSQ